MVRQPFTFLVVLLLLGFFVVRIGSASIINIGTTLSGSVNSELLNYNSTLMLDTDTGQYSGSFMYQGSEVAISTTLTRIGFWEPFFEWFMKDFWEISPSSSSIYGLSNFNFQTDESVTFSFGDTANLNVTLAGTAINATGTGTFSITTGGVNPSDAMLLTAESFFSPAGTGLIAFNTNHLFDNGEIGTASGLMTLLGDSSAVLSEPFAVGLGLTSLTITPASSTKINGTVSGNLSTIPEPSTYLLFAISILGILSMGYRQRKKAA